MSSHRFSYGNPGRRDSLRIGTLKLGAQELGKYHNHDKAQVICNGNPLEISEGLTWYSIVFRYPLSCRRFSWNRYWLA